MTGDLDTLLLLTVSLGQLAVVVLVVILAYWVKRH